MRDFMFVYLGGDRQWAERATPDEMKAIMGSWAQWAEELAAQNRLRNVGAGLTPVGSLVTTDGVDVDTDAATIELKELVGGYSVVLAKDLEEANALAAQTPFLKNNPQGTVLVRKCFAPPQD